jgi:hypothetical protein
MLSNCKGAGKNLYHNHKSIIILNNIESGSAMLLPSGIPHVCPGEQITFTCRTNRYRGK